MSRLPGWLGSLAGVPVRTRPGKGGSMPSASSRRLARRLSVTAVVAAALGAGGAGIAAAATPNGSPSHSAWRRLRRARAPGLARLPAATLRDGPAPRTTAPALAAGRAAPPGGPARARADRGGSQGRLACAGATTGQAGVVCDESGSVRHGEDTDQGMVSSIGSAQYPGSAGFGRAATRRPAPRLPPR